MSIFQKAKRAKARLRMSISGPSGSGKTYSAIKIAFGLGKKIVLIDSENGSGNLYANLGDYDTYPMSKPYEPEKLIQVIHEAEKEEYDVIIIDSLTHYWAGEGGLLERHEKIGGNSYTAWAKVTPVYQKMFETILQSKCHIIFTMRSKQDYVLSDKNGKQVPQKVGLAPVMREGAEYETTVAISLNINHLAEVSKDRTGLFDGKSWIPDENTGKTLLDWLESGVDPATGEQLTAILQLAKEQSLVEKMPSILQEVVGVKSTKELNKETADKIIVHLQTLKEAVPA